MEAFLARRDVRLSMLVAIVGASLFIIYGLRDIFAPLVTGFLIAYVLDPLADALEERARFSRFAAVATIYLVVSLVTW